jgi:hypothetical protein
MTDTVPEAAEPPQLEDGDGLIGGQQYTNFVNSVLHTDYDTKTIYGWLAMGRLPYGRLGARIMGSKRAIRQRLAQSAGLTA